MGQTAFGPTSTDMNVFFLIASVQFISLLFQAITFDIIMIVTSVFAVVYRSSHVSTSVENV